MVKISGIKSKYLYFAPLFGILSLVLLFFRFITMDETKEHITGFQIINLVTDVVSNDGITFKNLFILMILMIIPVVIVVTSIVALVKPNRKLIFFTMVLYALVVVGNIISIMNAKAWIDSSSYFQTEFLMKHLSIIYWILVVFQVLGLIFVMKSIKISAAYIVLCVMSVIWLFPIVWILLNSFRGEGGFYIGYFIPKTFTFDNYVKVWNDTSKFHFAKWFSNTLMVSVCSCILTSFLVLSTSFIISRIRFVGRKSLMNLLLILGMFPAFMSMIAVYYIIKGFGLNQSLAALVICYSAGASLHYYVSKGFFDTIPRSLDEAAYIDGATKWNVFTKITIPLSKSIIIFTILTSFMGPWADYIFSSIILGDKVENYTVAIGLYNMLTRDNIEGWYTSFAAGSILIAVPIAALFLGLQRYYVEGLSGSVKG